MPGLDVFAIGQAEMLFGRDVAEHGRAVPADHGGADGGGDVVVAGGDIGDERPERVERRFVAQLVLFCDLQFDLIERNVAGAFDHHLDVVFPGFLGQFAQRLQFGELGLVAGIGEAAGTQAVAQREADVVLLKDFADGVEVLVEQILAVVLHHPFGEDRAAAADDAGDALRGERNILHQHAGMDRHIIDALLGLLLDDFEHHVDVEVLDAAHARERFINRHRADGDRRIAR